MHVLGLQVDRTVAALVADPAAGGIRSLPLAGDFAWRLSPVRRCVGTFDGFVHKPCPTQEPVSIHRQCGACMGLDDAECVFEPRCQDNPSACTCLTSFKDVPHVVYLAFHGTLPKVGMTSRRRVGRRLFEQGADAYLVLQACADRGTARSIEKQVSYVHKIPEHRSHRETLPQLARPVPWATIEARAAEHLERLRRHYDVEPTLHRVEGHALQQPLPGVPRRIPTQGVHRGTWVGAKGNHLVYHENRRRDRLESGTRALAALKIGDLVGRTLTLLGVAGGDAADGRESGPAPAQPGR